MQEVPGYETITGTTPTPVSFHCLTVSHPCSSRICLEQQKEVIGGDRAINENKQNHTFYIKTDYFQGGLHVSYNFVATYVISHIVLVLLSKHVITHAKH